MRTSLWVSIILLALTIAAGCWTAVEAENLSQRYVSAAEELRELAAMSDWARAEETVAAYIVSWEKAVPWLQMLINHEDIDGVTLSLVRLQAAIRVRDGNACAEICAELGENARHIYHRDAFTVGNVL